MTTFTFETMTADQAASYDAATDAITFSNPSSHASAIQVTFATTITPPSGTDAGSTVVSGATITDLTTGHAVTFGSGVLGESDFVFTDSTKLFVGTGGNDPAPTNFAGAGVPTAGFLSAGDDVFTAGDKGGVIQGNQGVDVLTGGAGADTIYGGAEGDTIDGKGGANFLQGNKGADTVSVTGAAASESNTLIGGQGDDSITGGASRDFIAGDLGNDVLDGGAGGADTVNGGDGDDSLALAGNGVVSADGGAGADTISFAGTGGGSLAGGAGNDQIDISAATSKTLSINANAGDDTITHSGVSTGALSILAGAGNDHITDTSGAAVYLSGDLGDDSLQARGGNDTLIGGAGHDTIMDAGGSNLIQGGDGNDLVVLAGSTSADHNAVDLGAGDNTMTHDASGFGDTITGGAGSDQVELSATGANNDLIDLSATTGNDTVTDHSTGAVIVKTGAGADQILLFGGNATVSSGAGDDVIQVGGAGDLHVDGGAGNDVIVHSGSGNDVLNGGDGDDSIGHLGVGNDIIDAGAGNDLIHAGPGSDTLTGGAGSDTFQFSAGDSGALGGGALAAPAVGVQDRITDWVGGGATPVDKLHFDVGGSTLDTGANGSLYMEDSAGDYAAAAAFGNDRIHMGFHVVAVQVGGDVVVFADNGATAGALDATDTAVVLVGRSLTDIDFHNIA